MTVVIPAFNEQERIAHTLKSVALAVHRIEYNAKVVVVANACTDDTAGVAEDLGAQVVIEDRKGVSFARQTGLQLSDSEIIVNTDADTQVREDWLWKHMNHYHDDQVVGVAGSFRFDSVHPSYQIYRAGAFIVQNIGHFIGRGPPPPYFGCNSSFRKKMAVEFGGFEPGSDKGEDSIFASKLRHKGTIVQDDSKEISVVVSGRRFSTLNLVAEQFRRKFMRMVSGRLYGEDPRGESFKDVR